MSNPSGGFGGGAGQKFGAQARDGGAGGQAGQALAVGRCGIGREFHHHRAGGSGGLHLGAAAGGELAPVGATGGQHEDDREQEQEGAH